MILREIAWWHRTILRPSDSDRPGDLDELDVTLPLPDESRLAQDPTTKDEHRDRTIDVE